MTPSASCFTDISSVDAAITREADRVLNGSPSLIDSKLTSFENNLLPVSPDLTRLLIMKELYRCHDAVEDKFKALGQRNRAARSDSDAARRHLEGFYSAFEEITNHTTPPLGPALARGTHFLDLGCAPGGFATWLLQNTSMKGVGITLPWQADDHGITVLGASNLGIPLHRDLESFSPRFTVHLFDLCQVTPGPTTGIMPTELIPATRFDLIIANASIMLTEDNVPWARKIRLTFTQLLVAFQHLAIGGTLIVSLRTRPFNWVIDIIVMLNMTFNTIDVVKPSFQAKTSFAYFVCQGFSVATVTVQRICRCIQYLQDVENRNLELDTTKIPRISQAAGQLNDHNIIQLLAGAWRRQFNALRTDFERVLNSAQSGYGKTHRTSQDAGHIKRFSIAELPATPLREADSSNWRDRTAAPRYDDPRMRRDQRKAGFQKLFAHSRGSGSLDASWRKNIP